VTAARARRGGNAALTVACVRAFVQIIEEWRLRRLVNQIIADAARQHKT
jgi:hypothetical protein